MTDEMSKEDRKRWILSFLVDCGLALPPRVIHHNMSATTWSEETTKRLLAELAEDGLVVRDPGGHGYYRATEAGRRRIESVDNN